MLIDTHAHLYDTYYQKDIALWIDRARAQHVQKIIMPNLQVSTVASMIQLQKAYPTMLAYTVGLHPCNVDIHFSKQLTILENYLKKTPEGCIGIGEIGLDFYHNQNFKNEQIEAFHQQLTWAKTYQLPVIIHCRNAFNEVMTVLKQYQKSHLKGVFHCFSGTVEAAEEIINLQFFLGIGGIVTFKNSILAKSMEHISIQHVVLETDSPYLAPTPHRGKKNEPSFLAYIAKKCADLQKIDFETVADITTKNAKKIFFN